MTVYKYLAPDRIDVLRNCTIRFTQPAALNDPFELRPHFEELFTAAEILQHLEENPLDITPNLEKSYYEQPPEFRAAVSLDEWTAQARTLLESDEGKRAMQETFSEAFSVIREFAPKLRAQLHAGLAERAGILSLSEVPDSVLMWAHYAASHQGFLVGFDELHPFFNGRRSDEDEFFHLRGVVYEPRRSYESLMELDGERVLLSKTPEWSYERERRMLVPLDPARPSFVTPAGDAIHLRAFPPESVQSVIFGARSSPALRETIAEIIRADSRYSHVRLFSAVLDPVKGSVQIEAYPLPPTGA